MRSTTGSQVRRSLPSAIRRSSRHEPGRNSLRQTAAGSQLPRKSSTRIFGEDELPCGPPAVVPFQPNRGTLRQEAQLPLRFGKSTIRVRLLELKQDSECLGGTALLNLRASEGDQQTGGPIPGAHRVRRLRGRFTVVQYIGSANARNRVRFGPHEPSPLLRLSRSIRGMARIQLLHWTANLRSMERFKPVDRLR